MLVLELGSCVGVGGRWEPEGAWADLLSGALASVEAGLDGMLGNMSRCRLNKGVLQPRRYVRLLSAVPSKLRQVSSSVPRHVSPPRWHGRAPPKVRRSAVGCRCSRPIFRHRNTALMFLLVSTGKSFELQERFSSNVEGIRQTLGPPSCTSA